MPGGPNGVALTDGAARAELSLSVSEIRKGLEIYLSDHARTAGAFSGLPPIAMEKLKVIAFVQDDSTKDILHAVVVPVGRAKP